jgi:transglutaminase-like putative cysteine protease
MTSAEAIARRERLSPAQKLSLAVEIVVAYVRARRRLNSAELRAVAATMRGATRSRTPSDEDSYAAGVRLGAITTRVLGALPVDRRCLTASLVLTALLARRDIAATLVIGVRADPFAAHAWVEQRGQPLLPPAPAPFERLVEV